METDQILFTFTGLVIFLTILLVALLWDPFKGGEDQEELRIKKAELARKWAKILYALVKDKEEKDRRKAEAWAKILYDL